MDASILFDSSTPFNENKLAIFDKVVTTFFTTKNIQEREMADKCLNEFKILPDSWLYCDFILNNSQSTYSKIIALGFLEDVIKTKWLLLSEDQRLGIRNFLIDLLIKHVTDDQSFANNGHLINKLNYIIVLIAKFEWTSSWPTFLSEICTSSKSNQNLCENNLKMMIMLNEEINEFWKNSMTTNKALELKNMMSKEFSAVFDLCLFIFENSQNVKASLITEAVKLYTSYVKWFPLEFVFREDILSKFLADFKTMTFLRVEIMKCLGEIFNVQLDINKIGSDQYLTIKNITLQIYKNYVNLMIEVTNGMNLAERYSNLNDSKKLNFEEFCMQFSLSLICFFRNNLSYIEEFDFITGSANGNDFSYAYLNEIYLGLNYISQIHQIPNNEEILKATCEFWHWFCFKVCFLKEREADPDIGIPLGVYTSSLSQYILYSQELFYYKNCYAKVLEVVRHTLITKMTKPIEVKIGIDEDGALVMDPTINTIYQTLHETMRDSLIYLTHLDPVATEKIMLELLHGQTVESNWNVNLLNSLCWSIGCITGAMDEFHEKRFVVMVIKYLLNLCEMKKGKTNKAVVASNIMYVVGQYPRFLNAHWRFLKTVIKKLFEFMHETHPGVQDFACETFLKISIKCGEQVVIINDGENEPYINVLARSIKEDTADLQAHQKLMFYEAVGNMIHNERDSKITVLIQQMMQPTYSDWSGIFDQANQNPEILQHTMAIKALDLIIKINERVALSTKTAYWSFGSFIYDNLLKGYMYYSNIVNEALNAGQVYASALKQFKGIKRTILKFIQTIIANNDNPQMIFEAILPPLSGLIETYRYSHVENRDPDVLLVFAEILDKLKNTQYDYIVSIWNFLCLFTLDMIKSDFQSFPEHRQNFFILVKSLISNAFDSLFQIQDSNFNKDVLNAIIWAIRHDQPQMYEIGLETLLILIKNVNEIRLVNNINVADLFYKSYYYDLLQEILVVMTDSFHKAGFKLQIEIMQCLIQVVEFNQVSENLFETSASNKDYTINMLANLISNAFGHLNKVQIETFCIGLFNKCYHYHEIKVLIRDFLTNLKSFAGNSDDLYEEEKKQQIEEARQLQEKKRNFIPGMMPVYDFETHKKVNSTNYQTFN